MMMIALIALLTCLVAFHQPCYGQMAANLTDNEMSMQKRQYPPRIGGPNIPPGAPSRWIPAYPPGVMPQLEPCQASPVVDTGNMEAMPPQLSIEYYCGFQTATPAPMFGGRKRRSETVERKKRIIWGGYSVNGQWPWAVSIVHKGTHSCTGSLISPQWVLTAAHCFRENQHHLCNYQVVLGESYINLALAGQSPTGMIRSIAKVRRHPGYNKISYDYDIALVKLAVPVVFSKTVQPICLPKPTDLPNYASCQIAGWGVTVPSHKFQGSPSSPFLKHLNIPMYDRATCETLLQQPLPNKICIGNQGSWGDACFGDSGGPLVCQSATRLGLWIQTGVTSFGTDFLRGTCGTLPAVNTWIQHPMGGFTPRGNPTIYTDVLQYVSWIQGVIFRNGGPG